MTSINRSRCAARRHGTASAYYRGCRCPDAAFARSEYLRARATGKALPGYVPAAGTIRRLRGLYSLGHNAATIATAAGLTAVTVRVLLGPDGSLRPERVGRPLPATVHRRTADAVAAAVTRLVQLPGRCERARARARRAGWAPLHAWDNDLFRIDDPAADAVLAAQTAGLSPSLRAVVLADVRAELAARAARTAAATRVRIEKLRKTPTEKRRAG